MIDTITKEFPVPSLMTTAPPSGLPTYVILTPARNEAEFIELTLKSVVAQTVLPLRWVIISDGSTDGTDEIVQGYIANYPWIELFRMPEREKRNFAGKAHALNAGRAQLGALDCDVIVCLDADISFSADYFYFLLKKLTRDPMLGLVGTPYADASSEVYNYRFTSTENVSGACQVFRRQCFDDIGGYAAVKGGAIDTIACISARMKGWKTQTFGGKLSLHHRSVGTAESGPLHARFTLGKRDFFIGNHPLWELFRGIYQMTKRPFILRGLALLAGYVCALCSRTERPVSREMITFRRQEQMHQLATVLLRYVTPRSHRTQVSPR